jgi:hypothetical protein
MDYNKHYTLLIDRARPRIKIDGEKYELHHILPRCLGGGNRKINCLIVRPNNGF